MDEHQEQWEGNRGGEGAEHEQQQEEGAYNA